MHRNVGIDPADLESAERASRMLANRCKRDAKQQKSPKMRRDLESHASRCKATADRIRTFRLSLSRSPGDSDDAGADLDRV